jgi:hypothetical protein
MAGAMAAESMAAESIAAESIAVVANAASVNGGSMSVTADASTLGSLAIHPGLATTSRVNKLARAARLLLADKFMRSLHR